MKIIYLKEGAQCERSFCAACKKRKQVSNGVFRGIKCSEYDGDVCRLRVIICRDNH